MSLLAKSIAKRRALCFLGPVLAVTVGACGERRRLEGDFWGDDPGRPARLGGSSRLDAAAGAGASRDASSREMGGAGNVLGGGGDAGGGRDSSGSPSSDGGTLAACEKCEAQLCRDWPTRFTGELAPRCRSNEACMAVLDCVRRTKCAGPPLRDPRVCYCGTAEDLDCTTAGRANGPCKEEIENAADDTAPLNVLTRLYDMQYSSGVAMGVAICDSYYCSTPCLGYPAGANCVVDPNANPPVWGNALCETEACRQQGQCVPRSVCVELGDCSGDSDPGTSPSADGGTAPVADATPTETASPAPQDGPLADAVTGDVQIPVTGSAWSSAECTACVNTNVALGVTEGCSREVAECSGCQPTSGCDKMPASATSQEKALCQAELDCIRASGCWRDLTSCLCGTALDAACLTAANGPCRAEILAATKSTTDTAAGGLFLATEDPTLGIIPSGYAALMGACYATNCEAPCSGRPGSQPAAARASFELAKRAYLNFDTFSCEPRAEVDHGAGPEH